LERGKSSPLKMRFSKYGDMSAISICITTLALSAPEAQAMRPAVGGGHSLQRLVHGLEFGAQPHVAPGMEGAHPVFGRRSARFGFDAHVLIAYRLC